MNIIDKPDKEYIYLLKRLDILEVKIFFYFKMAVIGYFEPFPLSGVLSFLSLNKSMFIQLRKAAKI